MHVEGAYKYSLIDVVLKNWSSSVICQNTLNEVRCEIIFLFFAVAMTYLLWEGSWVALDRIVSPSLLHYLIYVKLRKTGFNQVYLGCHNYASCAGEIQLP